MGTQMNRFLIIINMFFVSINVSAQETPPGILGDRVVMEVDHVPYTQRQLELYILFKDILRGQQPVRKADAENWFGLLEEFRTDMIVNQEAIRLSSFQPSAQMLAKAKEIFSKRRSSDDSIMTSLQRLAVAPGTETDNFVLTLRVEAFRRGKQRQAAIQDGRNSTTMVRTLRFSQWLMDLEERAVVRYFDGSMGYQDIHPTVR